MAYESKTIRRQRVLYDNLNTVNPLYYQLVLAGAKVVPTSATISIYAPGSSTALVSADDMTVVGSVCQYPVDTTTEASWPISNGYRADVVVTSSVNSADYERSFMFDVIHYAFDWAIGKDQLLAFDDSILGLQHVSDEDLSELIESCCSMIQTRIESKVIEDKKLITNMILDSTRVANCAIHYILARLHFNKGDMERYNVFRKDYDDLLQATLNTIQYDQGQSGGEAGTIGGITEVRLSL